MNKGLDALNENLEMVNFNKNEVLSNYLTNHFIIEKELKEKDELSRALSIVTCENGDLLKYKKALDIIVEKEVNITFFKICLSCGWEYKLFEEDCLDNNEYNESPPYKHSMIEEQFN